MKEMFADYIIGYSDHTLARAKEHEIKGYAERIEERLSKLEERINCLVKIVRTGFASLGAIFDCPFCGENSKFVYDRSKKLGVCMNCGKTI